MLKKLMSAIVVGSVSFAPVAALAGGHGDKCTNDVEQGYVSRQDCCGRESRLQALGLS